MRRLPLPFACAASALLLTGCAADYQNYPSLARRPAERVSGTIEVAPPTAAPAPVATPPSADLTARLGQLGDQAQAAHREFTGRRARAEQLVAAASGAATGSDSWAQANVALADLETSRSQAMIALADLDALYTDARVNGGNAETIAATRDRVIDMIGEEDIALAQLRGRIAS
ncbi:MAG: hypothetical protein QM676_09180 [Novosphingobium sp.]